jgi:hypothetical protein
MMFSPWRKVSWASQRSLSDLGGQRFGNSLRSEGAVNSINPMSRSSGLSSRAVGKFVGTQYRKLMNLFSTNESNLKQIYKSFEIEINCKKINASGKQTSK